MQYSVNLFSDSSLNVSVTNTLDLCCCISSFSLTCHSLDFCLRHSIQYPQPTGTNKVRSSLYLGGFLYQVY